jgi:hypothetical protein
MAWNWWLNLKRAKISGRYSEFILMTSSANGCFSEMEEQRKQSWPQAAQLRQER